VKVSDLIAEFVAGQVGHVFTVSGGADLHIIAALNRRKDVKFICPQNEQAAGFMADAYARLKGMGCALVTSGPGAQNLVTPIATSFYDSVPSLYLSGQQTRARMSIEGVRQYGFQATPICDVVRSVCKHALTVMDETRVLYELQRAVAIARSGRPGPVVVDIPDDLQRAEVDPDLLRHYEHVETPAIEDESVAADICDELESAARPVLVLGWGVRLAGAEREARCLAETLKVPVLTTWATRDLYPGAVGAFGTHGTKAANLVVQNADYILSIGSRLDTKATSTPASLFAPKAKIVMVDIDGAEVAKMPKVGRALHRGVVADAKAFLRAMLRVCQRADCTKWNSTVQAWRAMYPASSQREGPYAAVRELAQHVSRDDVIVSDTGNTLGWMMQGYPFKGERFIHAFNNTPMGYGLPAALGAAFATGRRVVLVTGDGGLAVNVGEFATLARHELPIKIVLFNNRGHSMCRVTQRQWLGGEYPATSYEGGLACPDFKAVAEGFDIPVRYDFKELFVDDKAGFLELKISPDEGLANQIRYGESLAAPELEAA
jgi:acetolactate synthase-1/2/3 large subunit